VLVLTFKRVLSAILGSSNYATVLLSVAICLNVALTDSIYAPTFHLDGAFQTASGLFRLESGQLPGRDFYPYLGVGPLLAIFPIYKIIGGDLAATVAAAKFVTVFLSWMAVSTLWHFVIRPNNLTSSFVGGSLILFGFDFLASRSLLPSLLSFGLEPGNSLRPVRAVLPYLVALSIYFLIKSISHINVRNSLISAILGIALLWSNDFAIPTFALFFLFVLMYLYFSGENWVSNSLVIAVISILVWIVLLSFITAGHSFDLLKYNFIDVAGDQWWYFGPYGSNFRIFEAAQILKLISAENYFPLIVLVVILLLAIKTRLIEYYYIITIGLTIFAGGSLASVGGHLDGYFGSFYFWGVAVSLIFCLKVLILAIGGSKCFSFLHPGLLSISGLLMVGLMTGIGLQGYKERLNQARVDQNKFYVEEFGAFIDISFREYIDYARQNSQHTVVEDYWGLWSALNRRFPPWPVDSVIHALGNVRANARANHASSDIIITTRYLTSPEWQPSVLSQNYWFYDALISNWEPILTSPTTIVWKRSHDRSAFERTTCLVSSAKNSIELPEAAPGLFRLTIGYSSMPLRGRGRHLLMFRNNISFGFDAHGFLSLQPGSHFATFPVLLSDEAAAVFDLKIIGEAKGEILSCVADSILYKNDDFLHVRTADEDFFVTNGDWINGVARRWAGFFTHNTEVNRAEFRMGNTVLFTNGEKRTVIYVAQNGPYLNIWVDGEILMPKDVGFPSRFKVAR
jgi:hypothetical protein